MNVTAEGHDVTTWLSYQQWRQIATTDLGT